MRTLKYLYQVGILVKRAKCSNHSLLPFRITYTETISKPWAEFAEAWSAHVCAGAPDWQPAGVNADNIV